MSPRPRFMTAMAVLCAFGAAFLVYRDLTIPEVRDVEVWLGFELRGRAALLTAPLHWAILGVGAWAFWTQRRWIPRAAAFYAFYVGLSHLIWSEHSPNGRGWPAGLAQAAVFCAVGLAVWWLSRSALRQPASR